MTTQPFAVWSSITLLRTAPPSAATRVTTSAVWWPATDVSTAMRAPIRVRARVLAYAARLAAMNWSRRRPSRSSAPERS